MPILVIKGVTREGYAWWGAEMVGAGVQPGKLTSHGPVPSTEIKYHALMDMSGSVNSCCFNSPFPTKGSQLSAQSLLLVKNKKSC